MSAFAQYAPWYDLLYEDKDYLAEAIFVDDQLRRNGARVGTLLELGCGTGIHAMEFAKRGWSVIGVDLSQDMISKAQARTRDIDVPVRFRQGDVRQVGPERECDAVISLFHVASYQTDAQSLTRMFRTAQSALKENGCFLFDYWYGGAVFSQGLETRVKVVERPPLRVTRIATPRHNETLAQVGVHYTLFCEELGQKQIVRIDEDHLLRYWFPFEIDGLLSQSGFEAVGHFAWMTTENPTAQVWPAYTVARKLPIL